MRCFVDTNVFLYLKDPNEAAKSQIAARWLSAIHALGTLVISPQVINETFSNLLRLSRDQASREAAEVFARQLLTWCDAPLDRDSTLSAFEVRRRFQLSWWDSVLVSSALAADVEVLITEDLADGQRYGRLRAVNPFRHAPEDVLGPAVSR